MCKALLLALVMLCFSSGSGRAATYFVDWTRGSDSPERTGGDDTSQSWKTLSYACGRASGGDTIRIGASLDYLDRERCNLAAGVTIAGTGVDRVKITVSYPGGDGNGYIYREQRGQTVSSGDNDISGFTIDGDRKTLGAGIWLRGSDGIKIHRMKFQHIKSHAIVLAGYNGWGSYEEGMLAPPPVYGYHDVIHDVTIEDCSTKSSANYDDRFGAIDLEGLADSQFYNLTIKEDYPEHGTGIKAVPGWLNNVKIHHNSFYTDQKNGNSFNVELYNLVGNSEIYSSKFHHLISLNGGPLQPPGTWNLKIHGNDFALIDGEGAGNEFSHNNLEIYQNYFHDGSIPAAGIWSTNGMTGESVRNWSFHHNVVYNASNGIFIGRQSSARGSNNIEVHHNVFDTMTGSAWGGYGINGEALSGSCLGITVKNNIFRNCAAGPAHFKGFTGVVFDYNVSHGSGNQDEIIGTRAGKHNKVAPPGFAGLSNPKLPRPNAYYAPSGKSGKLRNAGAYAGLPPNGAAAGVGCCGP